MFEARLMNVRGAAYQVPALAGFLENDVVWRKLRSDVVEDSIEVGDVTPPCRPGLDVLTDCISKASLQDLTNQSCRLTREPRGRYAPLMQPDRLVAHAPQGQRDRHLGQFRSLGAPGPRTFGGDAPGTPRAVVSRQAAAEAGVSFSTFTRIEAGAQPDLTSFTLLCSWLGVSPGEFFSPIAERQVAPIDEAIAHLASDPRLQPDAASKIADVLRNMYDVSQRRPPSATSSLVTCEPRRRFVLVYRIDSTVLR